MVRAWALLAALGLAGCATVRQGPPPDLAPSPMFAQPEPGVASGEGVSGLAQLPGWALEDHVSALRAFQSSCGVAHDPALVSVCTRARRLQSASDETAATFFEANFRPQILAGAGLLTAYFAPEYPARLQRDSEFSAPLRGPPHDLVFTNTDPGVPPSRRKPMLSIDGALQPYPDRTAIELVPPATALAWMRPEDLFFMQIQGSGGLVFADGQRLRATYAADNGLPFVPIASPMVKRGLLAPSGASGESIRTWLAQHRGPQARAVMDLNPRYVFFNLARDDGRDPFGAAGLPLPPGRAIAVDPSWHAYGEPYWIDAVSPVLAGATKVYRRIVLALDTGSAIQGEVRADLYLGRGAAAGLEAGRVRHNLLLVRLVPIGEKVTGARLDEAAATARGD